MRMPRKTRKLSTNDLQKTINKENRKYRRASPCKRVRGKEQTKYNKYKKLHALGTCDGDDDSDASVVIVAVQC